MKATELRPLGTASTRTEAPRAKRTSATRPRAQGGGSGRVGMSLQVVQRSHIENFCLQPLPFSMTESTSPIETLDADPWKGDLLGRRTDARLLIDFLAARSAERAEEKINQAYVLNLDSGWGQGKTFFLTRMQKQLQEEGYLSIYINAWKDDHAEDPMVAVMSAIDDVVSLRLAKKPVLKRAWATARESGLEVAVTAGSFALKKLGAKFLGEGAEEIANIVGQASNSVSTDQKTTAKQGEDAAKSIEKFIDRRAEAILKKFRDEKKSIAAFKVNLSGFVDSVRKDVGEKTPIFILIDELDRCRPPYAISLLERVKHLFEIDGTVFVIATDTAQLTHSIKAVYGQDFDSTRYLLRFFNRAYHFAEPKREAFVRYLFAAHSNLESKISTPMDDVPSFFLQAIDFFGLTLRDIEQSFDYLRTIASGWQQRPRLEAIYLFPLVIAFQQGDRELFNSLSELSASSGTMGRRRKKNWEIIYNRGVGSYAPRAAMQEHRVSVPDFLDQFMSAAKQNIYDIAMSDGHSHEQRWLIGRFSEELQIRKPGGYHRGEPLPSLLVEYPALVQTAGRFTKPDTP